MPDETPPRPAGTPDRSGHHGGGPGEQSPLQARAAFLKNRSWEFVTSLNRGACERGRAQHGENSESHEAVAADWRIKEQQVLTLGETLDFLRSCHKRAPFLFFNGNTFADIGRAIADFVFGELVHVRRRELNSAVAHYISGVLARETMEQIMMALMHEASFQPGDRVKTLRGSARGVVVRTAADGRIVWRLDGGGELLALPEDLLTE
jgi:hypothetical protein